MAVGIRFYRERNRAGACVAVLTGTAHHFYSGGRWLREAVSGVFDHPNSACSFGAVGERWLAEHCRPTTQRHVAKAHPALLAYLEAGIETGYQADFLALCDQGKDRQWKGARLLRGLERDWAMLIGAEDELATAVYEAYDGDVDLVRREHQLEQAVRRLKARIAERRTKLAPLVRGWWLA